MSWLAVKLFLGGALKRLLSAFGWATKNPAQALCVLLAASTLWFWRADRKHIAERDKALADVALLVKAQQEAKAKQDAADLLNLKTQAEYNRQLEANHAKLEAARGDAVREFIAARRVRRTGSPVNRTCEADVHPDPAAPDPGPTAGDYVALKPEEIDAISKVELQNAERGEFIRGLIEQGLALPDPAF